MTNEADFSTLGLSEQMLEAVRAKGFETPTSIQRLHDSPPALRRKRHHSTIPDRHGQDRRFRTADTPADRTFGRRGAGPRPRPDARTGRAGRRRTPELQRRAAALDHGHLRRSRHERAAAPSVARRGHRRGDPGPRAGPHPPRHAQTRQGPFPGAGRGPTRCSTWVFSKMSKRS